MICHTPVLVAFAIFGCHAAEPPPAPERAPLGFASPESVLGVGDRYFVSNIGTRLDPLARDGDGFISEFDARGKLVAHHALPRGDGLLHAPKGMAAIGGRLYVADIDRVVGFALDSGARVFEAALIDGAPALLNDLDVESERTLLVTDTVRGAVYRLDLDRREFTTIAERITGANGIAIDRSERRAYVVGLGDVLAGGTAPGGLFALDLAGGTLQQIEGPRGLFDGVALRGAGELLISDWVAIVPAVPGVVASYTRAGVRGTNAPLDAGARSPADFYYDSARDRLWIPHTLDNRVAIIALGRTLR